MQYKLGVDTDTVYCIDTNYWIPLDPKNYMRQEYQKWIDEGNTPLPAEWD